MWERRTGRYALLRPLTSQFANTGGATPIDGRLHECKDRALQRGSREDLAPPPILVGRIGCVVVAGSQPPDLFEHVTGDRAGGHAEQHPDRLVGDLGNLAAHRRLPRTIRMAPTAAA